MEPAPARLRRRAMRGATRVWGGALSCGVVIVVGVVMMGSSPAFACSCVMQPMKQQVAEASGVFMGTVGSLAPGKNFTWEVQVERVYKGDPAATSTMNTGQEGVDGLANSCNRTLEVGRKYLFFADGGADSWTMGACDFPSSPTAVALSRVRALLGPPGVPTRSEPGRGVSETTRMPDKGLDQPWWWLGGGAVAVAGAGALALRLRRSSR